MKIYFMKQSALNTLKANMGEYYAYYFQKDDNAWMEEVIGEDPFVYFTDVPDFELADLNATPGEIDLENCKIIYQKLKELSPSQAADERLWAGLCNGTFYKYMRRRFGYTTAELSSPEKDAGGILSRFFFSGGNRSGLYRNTLAKSWWVGRATYNAALDNPFEMLDALGPNDLSSKISDIFYSNTFASNPIIARGICNSLRYFSEKGIKLGHRAHIRPAIQYLNAIGGATLLDMLSEEEIEKLMIARITELLKGIMGPVETVDSDDDDDIEEGKVDTTAATEENPPQVILDLEDFGEDEELAKPEYITYGCRVTVIKDDDVSKEKEYRIPLKSDDSRELYPIEKRMLGKAIGYRLYLSGSWYEVVDFDWDE